MSTQVSSSPIWPMATDAAKTWHRAVLFVLGGFLFLVPLLLMPRAQPTAAGPRWSPGGLQGQTVHDLRTAGAIIYARTATGLWRSVDGGLSWAQAHIGLPKGAWGQPLIEGWTTDAESPYTLYAISAEGEDRGLFLSTNGGGFWMPVPTADLPGPVLAMAARGSARLYLATLERVYRSLDGGRTWEARGSWPKAARPWRLAVSAEGVLYAAARTAGLWASRDEGESWQVLLAADVVAWDYAGDRHYVAGRDGAFRSDDAGLTWQALPWAAEHVVALAVDPAAPSVVYVGQSTGEVLISEDAGKTWREVSEGLKGQTILALALDPQGRERLYAASGDGVWRKDVAPPPYPTATPTAALPTATPTHLFTEAATSTPPEPSPTATDTPTPSPTPSFTPTATATPLPSPTRRRPTPLPPTPSIGPTPEFTSAAPSPTSAPPVATPILPTPTPMPPTPTPTPLPPTPTPAPPTPTPMPPTPLTPTPDRVLPTPTPLPPPPPR